MTDRRELSDYIRTRAIETGFDICGIARAKALTEGETRLQKWCDAGMNDTMQYLNRDIRKRMDPTLQFPGTLSVIVTGLNYYTNKGQKNKNVPLLSRYAYGKPYQTVIKEKLDTLLGLIKAVCPEADGRSYCDTAPISEKRWAVEAGLGWQGKHSIVINREIGSFFFIGILLINIELEYDAPYAGEMCGTCTKCLESCPTQAINSDFTIDARRCISNLTIENRAPVSDDMVPFLGGRIYACDKCQEVCPWNSRVKNHNHPELDISCELAEMTLDDWKNLNQENFRKIFSDTPAGRVKFEKFRTNLDSILKNE